MSDGLDAATGEPRYVRVARVLEREIRDGAWQPGKPVPSRVQIVQRFGIAQATAGRAHAWLAERGYLAAEPGIGMVVTGREHWPEQPDG